MSSRSRTTARRSTTIRQRYRLGSALKVVREWNALVRPGDTVEKDFKPVKTWSWAGLGPDGDAVVFVDGFEGPVPLCLLTVVEKQP